VNLRQAPTGFPSLCDQPLVVSRPLLAARTSGRWNRWLGLRSAERARQAAIQWRCTTWRTKPVARQAELEGASSDRYRFASGPTPARIASTV
jgi:hypothetical protein